MTDLTKLPEEIAASLPLYFQPDNRMGEPVGFRAITETGAVCDAGCLAPGSSPHSHAIVKAWRIIGTQGFLDVDPGTMLVVRAAMIHPLPEVTP